MEQKENQPCRKKEYQKVSFELKLQIVEKVTNGQISINHAAKKYDVSRSAIDYWVRKFATLKQKSIGMSKDDEIKKLKERIEALEFIKDFQQDMIADFELITGKELSKKYLPKDIAKEIEKKKRDILKGNG